MPPTSERASQLCREFAKGTNGNVPIQSVFIAMLRLIDREDVIEAIAADAREMQQSFDVDEIEGQLD